MCLSPIRLRNHLRRRAACELVLLEDMEVSFLPYADGDDAPSSRALAAVPRRRRWRC